MSAPAKEPDDTPVERRHVDEFLVWYKRKCRCPQYTGIDDHWFHALQTLTLGELRRGSKFVSELSAPKYIEPQSFWKLCKNPRSPTAAAAVRELRQMLKPKKET